MLMYVLESSGSSPGRQGFFMVVNANSDMAGSIGGGIMEHKFVEMAGEQLRVMRSASGVSNIRKQVHDKSTGKNQSGMICSGEQTILLYPVQEKDAAVIETIITSLEQNKNGALMLSPEGIQFDEQFLENDYYYNFNSDHDWTYKEKTGYKNSLFIIGGGHCALALSRLMSQMDFYIRIFDDRADLKTMQENNFVNEKKTIGDYSQLANLIPPGKNHYVVIMTIGYRSDDIALRALLGKEFRYIGVLGSKKKMEKLLDDYSKEGIAAELLQKIHTPVGLAIKSHTPEEIAVSIAAEIIRVKNQSL